MIVHRRFYTAIRLLNNSDVHCADMNILHKIQTTLLASVLGLFVPVAASAAQSEGAKAGLAQAHDPLNLQSTVALVADADSLEVLFAKNPNIKLPIASITKLMTVVVTLRAGLDLDEKITVTKDDFDTYKGTWSRLAPGSTLSRRDMIHLALMASENRAASALGRTYPGGRQAMVDEMNSMARQLSMRDTHFVETTGLSYENQSTANDLALLVVHAGQYPLIQEFSTSKNYRVSGANGMLNYHNTNSLIKKEDWHITLQKTGFINEAGRCMVMQAQVAGRNLVIVLLDSLSKKGRFADAERIRTFFAKSEF